MLTSSVMPVFTRLGPALGYIVLFRMLRFNFSDVIIRFFNCTTQKQLQTANSCVQFDQILIWKLWSFSLYAYLTQILNAVLKDFKAGESVRISSLWNNENKFKPWPTLAHLGLRKQRATFHVEASKMEDKVKLCQFASNLWTYTYQQRKCWFVELFGCPHV